MTHLPPTAIMVAPDGFYRVTTSFEFIGRMEDTLRSAITAPSAIHPSVAVLYTQPVGVALTPATTRSAAITRCWVRIPQLMLDTYWAVNTETNQWYPVFKPDPGTVAQVLPWVPPSGTNLYLVSAWPEPTRHTYLVATRDVAPGFFRPPLPNIFEDGRVCMGNHEVDPPERTPLLDQFKTMVDTFHRNPWNTDLVTRTPNNERVARALFAYTLTDTPEQVRATYDVDTQHAGAWVKINNAYVEGLPLV